MTVTKPETHFRIIDVGLTFNQRDPLASPGAVAGKFGNLARKCEQKTKNAAKNLVKKEKTF